MSRRIDRVVLVGHDVDLWLSACVLQSALGATGVSVTAIELPSRLESQDAYASLPSLEALHSRLKIDESALLASVGGSFSLGQNFVDASGANPSFFHPYGACGAPIDHRAFLPYWLMAHAFGLKVPLDEFSLTAAAAKQGCMLIPDATTESFGRTDYAYHLPALAYAAWLKRSAIKRGVKSHQTVELGVLLTDDGSIAALELSGAKIEADLFVDVSGAEGRLVSTTGAAIESWREYFPSDRRIIARAARFASLPPYAEVRMGANGWSALFPTQAGTHVLHAYSSSLTDDTKALRDCAAVCGLTLADASVDRVMQYRRAEAWQRNCVAIGASACVADPAHSVELQVLQLGLVHLLSLFPVSSDHAAERTEFNRICRQSFERIRDFQSAWYVSNRIGASEFWKRARGSRRSPELAQKLATFAARGDLPMYEQESFTPDSWHALLIGSGVLPETHDPGIERTPPALVRQEFRRILSFIREKVQEQTTHDFYLQAMCSR